MSTDASDNSYHTGVGARGISFADLNPPATTTTTSEESSQVPGNGEISMQKQGSDLQPPETKSPYESISQSITEAYRPSDIRTAQQDDGIYPYPDLTLVDESNNPITGFAQRDSSSDTLARAGGTDAPRADASGDYNSIETAEAMERVAALCSKDSAIPVQLDLTLERLKKQESAVS